MTVDIWVGLVSGTCPGMLAPLLGCPNGGSDRYDTRSSLPPRRGQTHLEILVARKVRECNIPGWRRGIRMEIFGIASLIAQGIGYIFAIVANGLALQ